MTESKKEQKNQGWTREFARPYDVSSLPRVWSERRRVQTKEYMYHWGPGRQHEPGGRTKNRERWFGATIR